MHPFTPSTEADTERFIAGYQDAVRELKSATEELAKARWQGEDCLHEMAFGETD